MIDTVKTRNGRVDIYLRCDRWKPKEPRDMETAQRRHTKRKGVGCTFKLKVTSRGEVWLVKTMTDRGKHNHGLMVYAEGHRQLGVITPPAVKMISDMTDAQVKPAPILRSIKLNFPELNPNKRHINNCRDWLKRQKSMGQNPAQRLLALAAKYKYLFWLDSDETGCVTRTFVAHRESVNILRTYPHVILLDSTYKTNRYKYPLVEVIGVTPTNKNFLIGWALLKTEAEADYR